MKLITSAMMIPLILGLSACGEKTTVADMQSAVGKTKDEIESRFGRPTRYSSESKPEHPGGYWVYNVQSESGNSVGCLLHFDLPHRVLDVDC